MNVVHASVSTKRLISSVIRRRCGPPPFHVHTLFMQHRQEYIRTRPQNPFATASWLHLLLTQCHPFDVSDPLPFPDGFWLTTSSQGGNGRVIRMIASVPLIIAGYPMINVDLDQRAEYYEGIRRVSGWMAHGGTLFTVSRSGPQRRSRTIDEMFPRRHAENPRIRATNVAHGLRRSCRRPFATDARRTQNSDQERLASFLSVSLSEPSSRLYPPYKQRSGFTHTSTSSREVGGASPTRM